ncbi:MAG TPA: site-2 protease family protein [Methanoregulaceae archaeon]|nr:site-2 protease family protein [Methanoregulaceae archaeon]
MNWWLVVAFLIAVYAVVALIIYTKKLFTDHITFYGPIMAIKSQKTAFFDWFTRMSTVLRIYGTIGVIVVVIVSVLITFLLFFALQYTLILQPEPTGIYEPRNILLLPGINEYVPSTFAVWFAFVLTIAIHEFGHGILCRVEQIKVRGIGVLIAVIPIGFFVEPDEEELNKSKGMPKMRMFGAGIMNNLVVGAICFIFLILVMGMAVPTTAPVIHGIYQNYSAELAGVPQDSLIIAVNGIHVSTRDDVSNLLNATRPGDTIILSVEKDQAVKDYSLVLTPWPEELGNHSSGFMGIVYYDGTQVIGAVRNMVSPIGFLRLISVPFDMTGSGQYLRILAFETPDISYYAVPYPAVFWGLVHLLFWCGWININVGIFNAIPMVPLDGGYIVKEGVERLLSGRKAEKYSIHVTSFISTLMLVILVSIVTLPYLLHL